MATNRNKKNNARDEFPLGYRWQLIDAFRLRANIAANIVRGLLFALSSGAVYFLISKHYDVPDYHILSIGCFMIAIATIIYSWDVQKSKSIERFVILRDEGYDSYLRKERQIASSIFKKNVNIDRASYFFIATGFLIEFLPKFIGAAQ